MTELEPAVHFDRMNKVVQELLKGNSATQIATLTGFSRKEVLEYVDEWKSIKDNTACILVTASDGIVFKKVFNYLSSQNCFLLVSTNRQYDPYVLGADDVLEIWKFSGFYSAEFPEEIRN
jgi:hypothetical protein